MVNATGKFLIGVLLLPVTWLAQPVLAQTLEATAKTDNVAIRVLSENSAVVPGERMAVLLQQTIRPHWHTYWQNPGDSGQPTAIKWELPAGAEASPIQWAAPQRIDIGVLTNYGYSDQVGLLSEISVPASWPVGQVFPIKGVANWLVCDDVCIPESVPFSLSVPTAASGSKAAEFTALFAAARAAQPTPSPWAATVAAQGENIVLRLAMPVTDASRIVEAQWFPGVWGVINHNAKQQLAVADGALTITVARGDLALPAALDGVITIAENTGGGVIRTALAISSGEPAALVVGAPTPGMALGMLLLFALLGGLILNVMPCVFPILAMKALSFVSHASAEHRERVIGGVAYTAGVLATFALLAGILLALKAAGGAVGWGFQLQNPLLVTLLAYVLFVAGLNLSGVFEIGGSFMGVGSGLAARGGPSGSFFTGALAAIVATPCTAPFMASAIGVALTRPAPVAMLTFLVLGLGLALPYLLLTLFPAMARALPKPGPWMNTMKQVLAFPLYASAAWLVWVLAQQAGVNSVFTALIGMVVLAFAFWLLGLRSSTTRGTLWRRAGFAAALVAGIGLATSISGTPASAGTATAASGNEISEAFEAAKFDSLRASGKPVFVNMTAAWCITCKLNERVALSGDAFRDALTAGNFTYMKGDWTNQNPEITRLLESFGRAGVPLYVVYPANGGAPKVLPQLLTESMVVEALAASGTRTASTTTS